ncbi:hypothetical protein D3C80_2097520 [compost metagenome]
MLFSHVACPVKPSWGRLEDSFAINANDGFHGPCIEYVAGSLVEHAISEVKYKAADEPLRDGKPTLVGEPDF